MSKLNVNIYATTKFISGTLKIHLPVVHLSAFEFLKHPVSNNLPHHNSLCVPSTATHPSRHYTLEFTTLTVLYDLYTSQCFLSLPVL
jgi:hypothetical protein